MKWVIVPNTFFHRDAMSVTTMFKLVLGVDMTVQQSLPPELHLADAALVPSLPQVNVSHVGLKVLLLVEP